MALDTLAQTPTAELSRRIADVVQYVTSAGILALLGLSWKSVQRIGNIDTRIGNVETLLKDPEQGLSPIVSQLRQRVADLGSEVQNCLGRLSSATEEISRLRDEERAALKLEAKVEMQSKEIERLRDQVSKLERTRGDRHGDHS